MLLHERLSALMDKKSISIDELKDAANVTYEMARRYKLGIAEPRKDKLEKIADFLGVTPSWLQFGEGVMIGQNNHISDSQITTMVRSGSNATQEPLAQTKPDDSHIYCINYLDVRAAAGMQEFSNADHPEIIRTIYLSEQGVRDLVGKTNVTGLRIINVPTDSMEPTIKKGDFVLIDTNIDHYNGDGIYAFSIDGNLFIKRLQKMIGGGFKVISDNKEKYEPEEMNEDTYKTSKFVGKFMKCWRIEVIDL